MLEEGKEKGWMDMGRGRARGEDRSGVCWDMRGGDGGGGKCGGKEV